MMGRVAQFKLCFLFALFSISLFAQRDLATLAGTVTDPQGARNSEHESNNRRRCNGLSVPGNTNESGEFVRPALKPGTYTVTVEAAGFKKGVQKTLR